MRQGMEWKGVAMLSSNEILDIMNQTFMLALRIALPFLLISMILGIVVAIFQAATSINEQTLSFVPKLIAIIVLLSILGSTLLKTMQDFFTIIRKERELPLFWSCLFIATAIREACLESYRQVFSSTAFSF